MTCARTACFPLGTAALCCADSGANWAFCPTHHQLSLSVVVTSKSRMRFAAVSDVLITNVQQYDCITAGLRLLSSMRMYLDCM